MFNTSNTLLRVNSRHVLSKTRVIGGNTYFMKNDARCVTCNTCNNVLSYDGLVEDYAKKWCLTCRFACKPTIDQACHILLRPKDVKVASMYIDLRQIVMVGLISRRYARVQTIIKPERHI